MKRNFAFKMHEKTKGIGEIINFEMENFEQTKYRQTTKKLKRVKNIYLLRKNIASTFELIEIRHQID